ncbi:hypothetical protein COLO4_28904 [Corchorus olitorius]|uniref:Uncharacterized protein n=1 Tax=Corchorus olitorius TaxID=93759 RepID=A0A1R3HHQ5_9ROSI|nr:hypothetical protein COLO4_28904 [Corchorus olitorius]
MLAGWCDSGCVSVWEIPADMARWALKASWSWFVVDQRLPTW